MASRAARGDHAPARPASLLLPTAQTLLVATLMAATLAFGAVEAWASASLGILVLVALALWAVESVRQGVVRVTWSPLYLPALLFLLLGLVQYFARLTADLPSTRDSLLSLAVNVFVFVFFLASQFFQTGAPGVARRLGLVIAIFASSLSLFAILQFFSSHGLIYWKVKSPGETFGPYVNRDDYAGLMEMLIPMTAAYALSQGRSRLPRPALAAAVLLPIASLLLSGSRGGLIAFLVEAAVLGSIMVMVPSAAGGQVGSTHRNRRGRGVAAPAGVVLAAAALFFWINPGGFSTRLWTVARVRQLHQTGMADRVAVVQDSWRILRDHAWLGTGLGSFEAVYPQYQTAPSNLTWIHAHNDYAEALAETGLAGGALIAVALAMFFRLAFRKLRERLEHEWGWAQLGAALACCGLLVHSLADFNLHIPGNAAWFAFCAAVGTLPRRVMARSS
jgi:O-antigen ligase